MATLDIDRFPDASVVRPAEFTAWPSAADGRHPAALPWRGPVDGATLPDGRRITVLPWRPETVQFAPLPGDATRWSLSVVVVHSGPLRWPRSA